MNYFVTIVVLFMTAITIQSNKVPNCLSTKVARKVMKREESVEDISRPRYYRVCPNTFIPIREYNYTSGKYIGPGQDAISIWNPNVHILCAEEGTVGKSENNCTFSGGTFHIDIIPADKYNLNMTSYKLEGISLEGFQFTNAIESNVVVYGTNSTALSVETNKRNEDTPEYGASVTIKDCLFYDNSLTTNIWVYEHVNTKLNVESSRFYDNILIEDAYYPHTGLITSYVGGHITIHDTDFTNNYMKVEELSSGHRAIIYTVHDTNTTSYSTYLSITNSTFLYNEGMTFSLALSGLWKNEDVNVYSIDNYQKGNIMSYTLDNPCYGVAHLIQNSTYWDTYYYYYYYHEDAVCDARFDTTEAPSMMPSSSPSDQPSNKPTISHPPSMSPSGSPSQLPSSSPSVAPSYLPSSSPSSTPTISHPPSLVPSTSPTELPSSSPSDTPTNNPTTPYPTTITPRPTKPKSTCYSDKIPLRIRKQEMAVIDVSKPRYYRVCPDTVIPIASYDYRKHQYDGPGQDAISIWNPNVHILCALTGKKGYFENNCTFTGGTFQIELLDGTNMNKESLVMKKISVEGFRFRNAKEANIIVYGKYILGNKVLNELESNKTLNTKIVSENNVLIKRRLNIWSKTFSGNASDTSYAVVGTDVSDPVTTSDAYSGVDITDASNPNAVTEIFDEVKILDEVETPGIIKVSDTEDAIIFGVELTVRNCVFEDNRLNTNIWIYKDLDSSLEIMESMVEVTNSRFTYNQIVEDYENPHLGLITSNIGGTFKISNTAFFSNFLDAPTLRSAHRAIIYSVQEQNDGYPTDLTLFNSTFENNSGMTFALAVTGLWFGEETSVNAYNNYQKGNYLAYTLNNPCYGVAHLIHDVTEYPKYYDYYYYHEDAVCDITFGTTEAPSMMPSRSPSEQPSHKPTISNSPSMSPTLFPSGMPSGDPIKSPNVFPTISHSPTTRIKVTHIPSFTDVIEFTEPPTLLGVTRFPISQKSINPTMKTMIDLIKVNSLTLPPVLTKCLSGDIPARIMTHEWSISDTSQPRYYHVCPGTVINMATFDYQLEEYGDDGEEAISIWNPNVHIVCGVPGSEYTIDDNCILNGGTFQIDIIAASEVIETFSTKPLENIMIEGFTFQGAKEANVVIYGTNVTNSESMRSQVTQYGANVILKNCQFLKNTVNTNIWIYENVMSALTIENCVFHQNIIIEDDNSPHVGLITSYVGGKIKILDSRFTNNQLDNPNMETGMRAIILAVQVTNSGYHTDLSIMNSKFLYNTGMTFTLALAGLWENENTVINSSNNHQRGNILSYTYDNPCYGIAHLIQDSTLFEQYYYYYYHSDAICDISFDTTEAPSMSPTASLEPSSVPYQFPSGEPTILQKKEPKKEPTIEPTAYSTVVSSELPTIGPTLLQIKGPTSSPTKISVAESTNAPSTSLREETDKHVNGGEENSEDTTSDNQETSKSSAFSSRFLLLSHFTIILSSIIVWVSGLL